MKVIDVILVGNFNEDARAKNIPEFIAQMGSHDFFSEVNEIEVKNRDGELNHGAKHADCALVSEGASDAAKGIELIECKDMEDSANKLGLHL